MTRVVLFHISDLHFGLDLPWPNINILSGMEGHDHDVANELEMAIRQQISQHYTTDECRLIVSGDLTVMGTISEMHMALSYLRGHLNVDSYGTMMGLGDYNSIFGEPFMVPGNHDHWAGNIFNAVMPTNINPRMYHDVFVPDATHDPWYRHESCVIGESTSNKFQLQIMGIESNWNGAGTSTHLAVGDINPLVFQELTDLITRTDDEAKQNSIKYNAKVLVIHHSPANQARDHRIRRSALQNLINFCNQNSISVVLSGHMHTHMHGNINAGPHDQPNTQFQEIRCGSSLQRTLGTNANEQVFLIHEIELVRKSFTWKTRCFMYNQTTEMFVENPTSFPTLKI